MNINCIFRRKHLVYKVQRYFEAAGSSEEKEKAAIHAEYEQERIAYQKLLKEYNTLKAAIDDLKERVNMLREGDISP